MFSLLLVVAPCHARQSAPRAATWRAAVLASRVDHGDAERVVLNGEVFHLDIAADIASRAQGMMGWTDVPLHGGVLFVYPQADMRHFWMANCLVDIDIAYLDSAGRITAMHEMKAEPPQRSGESQWDYEARMPRYSSKRRAQYAIELRAGTIKRLGLEVGQRIELDFRRLRDLAR